jgi:Zn-dependent protease with chaperone function
MRYLVFVNPRVFEMQAPEEGVRAIIAHELAHLVYFKRRKRVRLVGLVRLTSNRFTAKFERWADLKAISLGYGEGLKEYRQWLYSNVPSSKLATSRKLFLA